MFQKARRVVELKGARWAILSALHGLVQPGDVLEPYNVTLSKLQPWERLAWGEKVVHSLHELAEPGAQIVFLAGKVYRDSIIATRAWQVSRWQAVAPLEGLAIGRQLHWLKTTIHNYERRSSREA